MTTPFSWRTFTTAAAYAGVAIVFIQAFGGSGVCPLAACVPVAAWYGRHPEGIRAAALVMAGAALLVAGKVLLPKPAEDARRWGPVLGATFLAAVATSAATRQHYGDAVDVFQKLAQLVATVVGLYVIAVAGPRELARWRRTKYDERAAQAAAEAIVAVEDLLAAFDAITSPAQLKGNATKEEGEEYASYIRRWFPLRWESIEPQRVAFRRARVQAQIYLDAAACAPLLQVEKHDVAIRSAFIDWSVFIDAPVDMREQGKAGFQTLFTELPKVRPSLLRTVKDALVPIARYGVPSDPSAA